MNFFKWQFFSTLVHLHCWLLKALTFHWTKRSHQNLTDWAKAQPKTTTWEFQQLVCDAKHCDTWSWELMGKPKKKVLLTRLDLVVLLFKTYKLKTVLSKQAPSGLTSWLGRLRISSMTFMMLGWSTTVCHTCSWNPDAGSYDQSLTWLLGVAALMNATSIHKLWIIYINIILMLCGQKQKLKALAKVIPRHPLAKRRVSLCSWSVKWRSSASFPMSCSPLRSQTSLSREGGPSRRWKQISGETVDVTS